MAYLELARPKQWTKGAFVLIGPVYGMTLVNASAAIAALGAFLAFAFFSSACYIHNDIMDRTADLAHPRKRRRPIPSGRVSTTNAALLAGMFGIAGAAALFLVPSGAEHRWAREFLALAVAMYVGNVLLYSAFLKRLVVADVMSLALGFVLRVVGGCAAVGAPPSTWLLNVTLFVAMFLAFGKRLGERRTMGQQASAARIVQSKYTDDLLRMSVVVTGVATLLTYAQYVQAQGEYYTLGFNLLWLTMLPATYGLLRAMVKVETGMYDDPTELASKDRPFQLAVVLFGGITVALIAIFRLGIKLGA